MKYAFITGIPTSGKSFLAKKVSKQLGILHIKVDDWRDEMKNDPKIRKWVDYFWDQNEEEYWKNHSCDTHWDDFIGQSQVLWPFFKNKMLSVMDSKDPAIFEGVYLLPRFVRELGMKGVVLLGNNLQETYERIKKTPRWGKTEELQKKEAEMFFNCKGIKYREEAERHGFCCFRDVSEAEEELLKILS